MKIVKFCLMTGLAFGLPFAATAQQNVAKATAVPKVTASDIHYCEALSHAYSGMYPATEAMNVADTLALSGCENDTQTSIATLEKMLKDQKIELPPAASAGIRGTRRGQARRPRRAARYQAGARPAQRDALSRRTDRDVMRGLFSLKKIGNNGNKSVSHSGSSFVFSVPDEPAAPAAALHDAAVILQCQLPAPTSCGGNASLHIEAVIDCAWSLPRKDPRSPHCTLPACVPYGSCR